MLKMQTLINFPSHLLRNRFLKDSVNLQKFSKKIKLKTICSLLISLITMPNQEIILITNFQFELKRFDYLYLYSDPNYLVYDKRSLVKLEICGINMIKYERRLELLHNEESSRYKPKEIMILIPFLKVYMKRLLNIEYLWLRILIYI